MSTLTKMNALTRFNADTPVEWDIMNAMCTEIEARDDEINNKFGSISIPSSSKYLNGWESVSGSTIRLLKIGSIVFINGYIRGDNGALTTGTKILDLNIEGYIPTINTRLNVTDMANRKSECFLVSVDNKCIQLQSTVGATTYNINGFYFTT